jgi:cytoskeletal protein RodZ
MIIFNVELMKRYNYNIIIYKRKTDERHQLPSEKRREREGEVSHMKEELRNHLKKRENEPEYLRYKRYVYAVIPLIAALLSFFPIGKMATDPARYANTIAALDEKKTTVMELTAASTASSAAITLIPGDVATPLADKLADISGYFVIVICALYLEKYLLTILGFAAFKILIPIACVVLSAGILQKKPPTRETLIRTAVKIALFGFALFLVVPASVKASDMITATYQDSIDSTLENARKSAEELAEEKKSAENGDTDASSDGTAAAVGEKAVTAGESAAEKAEESQSWWDSIVNGAKDIAGNAKNVAVGLLDEFQQTLNHLIEALAVMIVTSCLIPILVILFFVWIIKTVLNLDFNLRGPGRRE